MKLSTEIFGDVAVVHTPEEVGEDQAEELVDCLTSLNRNQVIVDLDRAEAIDSKGLEALLDVQHSLRASGGDLKLAMTNPVNRKIFEITRLDQQMEVFRTVIDAVKSFV